MDLTLNRGFLYAWIVACFIHISVVGGVRNLREARACEGSTMSIICPRGQWIAITRANYGRLSYQYCNPEGLPNLDTRCMSVRTVGLVSKKCHGRRECQLEVNNNMFGDRCPNTPKYLEVTYECKKGGSPITPPPSSQSATTTTSTSTTTSSTPEPTTTTTTPTMTTTPKITTRHIITTRRPVTTEAVIPSVSSCKAQFERDVRWPVTNPGVIRVMPCPGEMTGQAKWTCGTDPVRWVGSPDLSDCKSKFSEELNSLVEGTASSETVAKKLQNVSATENMFGGDLVVASEVMHQCVQTLTTDLNTEKNPVQRLEKAKDVNSALVKTTSNLLSEKQSESWDDLPKTTQSMVATTMVDSLEESAFELADALDHPDTVVSTTLNILMKVEMMDANKPGVEDIIFPTKTEHDPSKSNPSLLEDQIVLPASAVKKQSGVAGRVTVVLAIYDKISMYMAPKDRLNDTDGNSTVIVNTNIISASLNSRAPVQLTDPVKFIMKHLKTEGVENPSCAYWDYKEGDLVGDWSTKGCTRTKTNLTHTVCECNHLTNFAVLMDVVGTKLPEGHRVSLQIITYAGCVVSIVCLFLSFLTFQCFRNLQSDRNTIHKNLVLSLLVAEIIFLAGIMQYNNPTLCAVIAGLLHFFFLASFAWMCLEGVQLYVMLIEVFEAERSRVKWYYLSGYGIPAVVVGISAAIYHQGYGTDRHCWLSTENHFIWAFVGPVVGVITINIVMLSIAIYMMCRHAQMTSSLKTKEKSRLQNVSERSHSITGEDAHIRRKLKVMMAWIKGAIVLVVLLGLTWAFGLLYLSEASVVMAYIFTILNTLQGLFIFVFHCIMNDKVQKEYKKCVRRSSWMPECIRVAYGGQPVGYNAGSSGTPSRSNSTGGNYFTRFLSGRRRKKSSTTSLPKSNTPDNKGLPTVVIKNPQADEYSSVFQESDGTEKCHNIHPQDTAMRNGDVLGDLSVIDASIVDTDFVSEYCQNNMMVTSDGINYRSKIPLNVKNRFSGLSEPGEITESDYSDAELFKMTDYDSKPRKVRNNNNKEAVIHEELENDGYEVPIRKIPPPPTDKKLMDKILETLSSPLGSKHTPSCNNLSTITEGTFLEDSTLCKSTPNLQYKPPVETRVKPKENNRDSFQRSMPNLAGGNHTYSHDSSVPSDNQKLLRNSMIRRSGSDPGHNPYFFGLDRYRDSSEC